MADEAVGAAARFPDGRDPGPLARLEDVRGDEGAAGEVFRLLTDADEPLTLPEIAKAWRVPKGRFTQWFSTEHKALLDAAERVLGIEVCHAVKKMTDDATQENFALVKFKTDRYLRLAGMLNAERYSPKLEHKHSGISPTLVIEIVGAAAPAEVVIEQVEQVEAVMERELI